MSPYLSDEELRAALDESIRWTRPMDSAQINFVICRLIHWYLSDNGLSYATIKEVDSGLHLAANEFHDRIVAPYEARKRQENGDVFDLEAYL